MAKRHRDVHGTYRISACFKLSRPGKIDPDYIKYAADAVDERLAIEMVQGAGEPSNVSQKPRPHSVWCCFHKYELPERAEKEYNNVLFDVFHYVRS